MTDNGGSIAAAIATHAIVSDKRVNPRDIKAINPDAKAIKRSIIVGDALAMISAVNCVNGTTRLIT